MKFSPIELTFDWLHNINLSGAFTSHCVLLVLFRNSAKPLRFSVLFCSNLCWFVVVVVAVTRSFSLLLLIVDIVNKIHIFYKLIHWKFNWQTEIEIKWTFNQKPYWCDLNLCCCCCCCFLRLSMHLPRFRCVYVSNAQTNKHNHHPINTVTQWEEVRRDEC